MAFNFFNNTIADNLSKTNSRVNNMQSNFSNINTNQNFNPNQSPIPTNKQAVGSGNQGGNQIMASTPSWGEIVDQGTGGGENVPDDIWQGSASGWDASDWVDFFQNSSNYNWNNQFWGVLNGMVGSSSASEILNWASHNFYNDTSGGGGGGGPEGGDEGGSLQDDLMDMYNEGNYDFNQDGLIDMFDLQYAQQNTDWDFSGDVEWVQELINSITGGSGGGLPPSQGPDPLYSPSRAGKKRRLMYGGTSGNTFKVLGGSGTGGKKLGGLSNVGGI